MQIYKIYDNGGKTWDRYTVLTEPYHFGKSCNAFGLSKNAKNPQGFNQSINEVYEGADIGKEISFDDLPKEVQEAIFDRMNELN